MLTPGQKSALDEIERQVRIIRALDVEVIPVTGRIQDAINTAPEGSILDLQNRIFTESIVVNKPLTIQNGTVTAPPNTNDLVDLVAERIKLNNLRILGDGTTKRGINNQATHVELDRVEVRNIRRLGQETQAMAMWNSPGPLTIRNSILEAGSIGFIGGGSRPTIPNTVPSNLLFENVLFTRPLAWRGTGYSCKNAFELKSGRNVIVRDCTLENVWAGEGQPLGAAIVLTPVNYTNSPETVIENIVFERPIIRNVGQGVNLLGLTQEALPTLRTNNLKFLGGDWTISRAQFGGHGGLIQIGKEPEDIEWNNNIVRADGDAFLRTADSRPINDFRFTNNVVNVAGQYGVFTPIGSRGVGWNIVFPAGLMENNTFHAAHSIFRSNFPMNTYVP